MKFILRPTCAHFLPSTVIAALVLLWPFFARAQAFSAGDLVQANGGYTIRTSAAGASTGYYTVSGTQGTIVAPPTYAAYMGVYYWWYDVTWKSGEPGWSIEASMTLVPPAPSISSVNPNPVTANPSDTAQTLTIYGANFVNLPTLYVTYPGGNKTLSPSEVAFLSATELTMTIQLGAASGAGTWTVQVTNPDGQPSGTASFVVNSPAPPPSISSVNPNPVTANPSDTAQTLTIYGASFVNLPTLYVTYPGGNKTLSPSEVAFLSATELTMTIQLGAASGAGTWTVQVTNPDGQPSGTASFVVNSPAPPPSISSVNPNPVTANPSDTAQTLTIYGASFVNLPTLYVTYPGGNKTLSPSEVAFLSATELTMTIQLGAASGAGTWTVQVTNPDGQPSGTASFVVNPPAPPPSISSVNPNPVTANPSDTAQTLTIYGANFVNLPTLYVTYPGGNKTLSPSEVAFLSATELTMTIQLGAASGAGTWTVQVTNPDGQPSGTASFVVNSPAPPPSISSVNPNPVTANPSDTAQTLTIYGASFVNLPTLYVTYPGGNKTLSPSEVAFLSATELTMTIQLGAASGAGTWTVQVTNPDGQPSGTASFVVNSPAPPPSISSVNPNPVTANPSDTAQTLTIYGASFVNLPTLYVTYPGGNKTLSPSEVAFLSATELTMTIQLGAASGAGTWTVQVTNPDGQPSGTASFVVNSPAPPPSISSVNPNPVTANPSDTAQTLTIYGASFVNLPTLYVTYPGGNKTLSPSEVAFLSATELTMTIQLGAASGAGTWTVQVTNPDGQPSGTASFVVNPPAPPPSISSVNPNPVTANPSDTAQTLTIYGANFVNLPTLYVTYPGGNKTLSPSEVSIVSSMAVTMTIQLGAASGAGTWTVQVTNPDGQPSGTASFVVNPPGGSGTLPVVQTLPASSVATTSAQLNGNVNPNGTSTSAYFEYGTTVAYGSTTPEENFGTASQSISYTVTQLSPNTVYHYQIVASYNNGPSYGSDATFKTAALPAEGSSFSGQVFSGTTGDTLSGATVQLGANSAPTDANGNYFFYSVAPSLNPYVVVVSDTGYATFSGTVLVTAGSSPFQTITLYPVVASSSPPVVTSVNSQYSGALYFLDGISFPITFTANVDWAGHPPGTVRFITPKDGTFDVSTTGNTASQSIDVGIDFGVGGQLQVVALSGDGSQSVASVASFVVMSALPNANLQLVNNGSAFSYQSVLATPNFDFLNDGLPPGISFDSNIPLFGDNPFDLTYLPSLGVIVNGNQADYTLAVSSGNDGSLLSFSLAGQELDLTPQLNLTATYNASLEQWTWNGSLGVQGDLDVSESWPFAVPTPIGPLPMFARADLKLSADGTLNILNLDPVTLSGTLALDPTLIGTLGVGLDDTAAVAGWIQGQGDFTFQYPQSPALLNYELQLSVGGTEYAHLWILNIGANQVWDTWTWPNSNPNPHVLRLLTASQSKSPQQYPRTYLTRSDYATFDGRSNGGPHPLSPKPSSDKNPLLYPLQTQVFPFSEPSISAAGTNCYAVWLYDNPKRTANNQTMLVFSEIQGTQWSEPTPVADDGTADFHPQLQTFADGSAVVTWENEGTELTTNATLTDITTNLEIATAFYNPVAGAWQPMQQLTTNSYLDHSPRISGPADNNLMLVWVANTNNDSEGSATNINQLWFTTWNGSAWSAPQVFANVQYPLLKYDMIYDGTNAFVVMSLDADNTVTNLNAHELFEVPYQNGNWGTLQQLTTNQVPDDNPQLSIDQYGHIVLAWLQGNSLSSVLDFNFTNQRVIRTNEYSINLSNFRLANSSDGRLSVIWAEPSQQYSSDLWVMFYDPIFGVWGGPRQLTTDSETEMETAATFFNTNQLVALYDRVDIAIGETNQSGSVITNADLYVLQYELTNNLALVANSLMVSPADPTPSNTVTLSVTAENLGDSSVSGVLVAFYQGDPAHGGMEIGETTLAGMLAPGATGNIEIAWTVPATTNALPIYAVIDPNQQFSDSDLLNNEATNLFVEPDLAMQSLTWTQISSNLISVVATVINQGTIISQPATVSFLLNSLSGTNLFSTNIVSLAPGQSVSVNFIWNVSSVGSGLSLFAVVNDGINAPDFNPANNVLQLMIQTNLTAANPQLGQLLLLSGGAVQVTVTGLAGQTYPIQVSSNLIDWSFLTNLILTNSSGQFIDSSATNFSQRFYRAKSP